MHAALLSTGCACDSEMSSEYDSDEHSDGDDASDGESSSDSTSLCPYKRYKWLRDGAGNAYKPILQVIAHDWGLQADGYFLLVSPEAQLARILRYHEDSYYSSKTGVQEHAPDVWSGSMEELWALADDCRHPKLPARRLDAEDHDYKVWTTLFDAVAAWREQGCPMWQGRFTRQRPRYKWWQPTKTPLADVVAAEWRAKKRAATRIQAAFRGWRWRLRVLYNPHTEIGARYLRAQFDSLSEV